MITATTLAAIEPVAYSQGCDVMAAAVLDSGLTLVLLASDHDFRVTTYREGNDEFGPGYYNSTIERAISEFSEQLAAKQTDGGG